MASQPHEGFVLVAVVDRRTVVRSENHEGILRQAQAVERAHHLAHRPVELQNHVPARSHAALARKPGMRHPRDMYVVSTHIEEEGFVPMPGDELRSLQGDRIGDTFVDPQRRTAARHPADARNAVDDRIVVTVTRTQLQQLGVLGSRRPVAHFVVVVHLDRIVGVQPHDPAVLHEDARNAVHRRGNEVFVIETDIVGPGAYLDVEIRTSRRPQPEVPFPDGSRSITRRVQGIGERIAGRIDDKLGVSGGDLRIGQTPGIHTRQQPEARRRAGRRGGIGVRETLPLRRKTVDIRRRDFRGSIATQIADTQIVGEDKNYIGASALRHRCRLSGTPRQHGERRKKKISVHKIRSVRFARSADGRPTPGDSPTESIYLKDNRIAPIARLCEDFFRKNCAGAAITISSPRRYPDPYRWSPTPRCDRR